MASYYQNIKGWFNFSDLYDQMIARIPEGQNARFVEVGVWRGRSLCYMAERLLETGRHLEIELFAVDTWQGSEEAQFTLDEAVEAGGSMKPTFDANMQAAGVSKVIQAIEMPSVEAAEQFEDESLDFVFIDASHLYEAVKADILAWLPKVKFGGVIGGHDYNEGCGVNQAVQDTVGTPKVTNKSWWIVKS